jgi:hypothetical protein
MSDNPDAITRTLEGGEANLVLHEQGWTVAGAAIESTED